MTSDLSFSEFPPVASKEWEKRIREDLGEADYGDTLLWHTEDGITVRPFYRDDDLARLEHVSDKTARPVGVPASWSLRQDIATPDLGAARDHARRAVAGGVDLLGISLRIQNGKCCGLPLETKTDFADFASDLPLTEVPVHLDAGRFSPALLALYAGHMEHQSHSIPAGISTAFDPVGEIVRSGRAFDEGLNLAADMVVAAASQFPEGRVLQVGAGIFHEAGATPVQETALLLASVAETMVQLIERGTHARDLLRHLHISVPVSSSYLMEIARLRALRLTLSQLFDAFLPDQEIALPPIHGETSLRSLTLYDPHTNLLRATTQAASAIVGGCDVISVRPFDAVAGRHDEFSYRMARNIPHILRDEAGLAHVVDAAAGSYYVEYLTDAVARRAWQLFREIEDGGGLIKAIEAGLVHEILRAARSARLNSVAERRRIVVGTNHYPVAGERRARDLEPGAGIAQTHPRADATSPSGFADIQRRIAKGESIWMLPVASEGTTTPGPLPVVRDAEQIERIRLRTERSGHSPRIVVVPLGDAAVRRVKARFARDFLACGGFDVAVPIGYDSVTAASKALREMRPDVVVFCAPRSDYARILDEVGLEESSDMPLPLIGLVADAGVQKDLDGRRYDFVVGRNSDLVANLEQIQHHLGIHSMQLEDEA